MTSNDKALKSLIKTTCVLALLATPMLGNAALLTAEAYARTESSVSNSDTSSTGEVSASVNAPWSEYDGSTARSTATGDQDGGMFAKAELYGEDLSWARITQSVTFTNNTGVDQNYFFDFTILPGKLEVAAFGYKFTEYGQAGYEINISMDGASLFESSAMVRIEGTGALGTGGGVVLPGGSSIPEGLSKSGVDLGGGYTGNDEYGRYVWGEYTSTLDLGVIQTGQEFTLEYDIYAYAKGRIEERWACADPECGLLAISVFGDPNHLSKAPLTMAQLSYQPASPTSVPEPGLWLLMGTGLFGFAVARRRRG